MIIEAILDSIKKDYAISKVAFGLRFNAVISRCCGISSRLMRETPPSPVENMNGLTAVELAHWALSEEVAKSSIGIAAINSLIEIDEDNCSQQNASEIIEAHGKNKNISVIGHFPFTERLKSIAKNLWVMEKNKRPGDFSAEDAEKFLPMSDVVAISGTTLINHTVEKLLDLCPEKSVVLILGGSTPLSPVLFDFGIDYLSGCKIIDANRIVELIKSGATFMEIKKSGCVTLLTMPRHNLKGR